MRQVNGRAGSGWWADICSGETVSGETDIAGGSGW
jgi:hypothetical protein